MKYVIYPLLLSSLLAACSGSDSKHAEEIKKTGTNGSAQTSPTQTIQGQIKVSDNLKSRGLKFGKYTIEKGNKSDNYNVLHVYVVFDNNFKEEVNVRVYDKNNNEYGRISKKIKSGGGEAKWIDFEFDERTDLESGSRFEIE